MRARNAMRLPVFSAVVTLACLGSAACGRAVDDAATVDCGPEGSALAGEGGARNAAPSDAGASNDDAGGDSDAGAPDGGTGDTGGSDAASTNDGGATSTAIAGLFSTGVDATGAPLAQGSVDPHYALASSDPNFPGPSAFVPQPNGPLPAGWASDTTTSNWTSVAANTSGDQAVYTYTTTFTLTGVDPATANIAGTWACADSCTMSLNGVQIAAYADPAWMSAEPFSIPAGSPFHNGTNTLAVAVTSAGTASTGVQIVTIGGNANVPFGAPYVVWLDAAKGVTQSDGGVSVWADQSGHGNDATPFPTQPLPTYTPVSIGGLPTMHFDGDYVDAFGIADAPSLDWGTDDYAVVLVAKYTNATPDDSPATWGTLWDKNCGTGTFVGAAMWGIYPTGDPGGNQTTAMTARAENHQIAQVPITTDDGNPHVLAMRRTGTTLYVWADGVGSSGQVPLDDVSQTGCGVDIGGALQGDIAEIIAIHGTVSDATMSALEQSLRTKYGF